MCLIWPNTALRDCREWTRWGRGADRSPRFPTYPVIGSSFDLTGFMVLSHRNGRLLAQVVQDEYELSVG